MYNNRICNTEGKITVVDYISACIKNIQKKEKEVKAWKYFNHKSLLNDAEELDLFLQNWKDKNKKFSSYYKEEKRDKILEYKFKLPNRIFGIPIGIKDIFNTSNMPTEFGSSIYKSHMPGNDARVGTNLIREGGIIAGKTNTSEFAVHDPALTTNPYNYNLSPGSSSSGSAAAVSSQMVPLAISTQTAASTIRPASYCGIIGFKPTFGVLPRTGVLKTTDTLDTIGIMARSIADIRLAFDVMRVRGPNYPIVYKNYTKTSVAKKKKFKLAKLQSYTDQNVSTIGKEQFNNLLLKLKESDKFSIFDINLESCFNESHIIHDMIYNKSLSYYFKKEWEQDKSKFSSILSEMIKKGNRISNEQYFNLLKNQSKLSIRLNTIMKQYDAIICLSAADDAPKIKTIIDPKDNSLIFTLYHLPSISLPLLIGSKGLPLGIQLACKKFDDYNMMHIAEEIFKIVPSPKYKMKN